MSLKKSLAYLLFIVVFFVLFANIGELIFRLRQQISVTADLTPSFYFPFLFIPLGLLLGLPVLLSHLKENGSWKVKHEKLLFAGLPALFFTCYPLIYFYVPYVITPRFLDIFVVNYDLTQISGLVFGYILITSFYRESASEITYQEKTSVN
ncbi:hypothetical protein MM300_21795 [Evansella sp. LMS18]|uniref:hypothetical protein n=1 Tax=Evansella sp. LMS18 TaxID=2924033 RepID=UPI0020D18076|nr:hypothetical protein [Evansella sp. LMS18]UTR10468.1 hypothetical protein MM300_21795 [Evansella sp. LMS18]